MGKVSLAAAAALVVAAYSTPAERRHERLMDEIEQKLQLPEAARPLGEYARYYAYGSNGDVEAVYLIPFEDALLPGEGCEEVMPDFTTKEVPCPDMESPYMDLAAGERRWVPNTRDLPRVFDGGCGVVNVRFSLRSGSIKQAVCNGSG